MNPFSIYRPEHGDIETPDPLITIAIEFVAPSSETCCVLNAGSKGQKTMIDFATERINRIISNHTERLKL